MTHWSWHTWRRDRLSLRRVLPTLAVLSGLLAATAGIAAGASRAIERDVLSTGGLTQIELSSFEGESSVRPLTTSALAQAARIPAVRTVVPDYTASIDADGSLEGAYVLSTHTLGPGDDLPLVKGRLPSPLRDGQVILPATAQGTDFRPYVGKKATFGYTKATGPDSGTNAQITLDIVAAFDPSWQADGPDAAYLTENTAALLAAARAGQTPDNYRAKTGATTATVVADHQSDVKPVTAALQKAGFLASPVSDRIRQLPGLFGAADILSRTAVAILALTALALGITRASDSTRARLASFATLRVLGTGVPELKRILLGEALLTGLAAGLTGTLLGTATSALLAWPLSDLLALPVSASDAIPGPGWITTALLLPAIGLAAGALVGIRKPLSQDPYITARRNS
ncbi:FtsX-like permease family protein [Streptomyces sp. NPDC019539]|uniref:FtsX-like permease family protein n=1 Tax=Streptomyces sp. NPDC019539 TaxID=3365063 RepID=UPI0037A32AD2